VQNYSGILNSLLLLESGFSAIFHTGIILHGNLAFPIIVTVVVVEAGEKQNKAN
jgi:hypothetical protein